METDDLDTEDTPSALTYKLTLDGDGMSFKRTVPEDVALDIIAVVMGGSRSAAVPAPAPGGAVRVAPGGVGPRGARQSLREYLDEIEAKRNVDKILGIATYLADFGGHEDFTAEDVKREFQTASEPVPGNFPRDFRWATGAGWLAPVQGEPGRFYVTTTGRDAVAARFSKDVKKATGVNKTTRRRRSRPKAADA